MSFHYETGADELRPPGTEPQEEQAPSYADTSGEGDPDKLDLTTPLDGEDAAPAEAEAAEEEDPNMEGYDTRSEASSGTSSSSSSSSSRSSRSPSQDSKERRRTKRKKHTRKRTISPIVFHGEGEEKERKSSSGDSSDSGWF